VTTQELEKPAPEPKIDRKKTAKAVKAPTPAAPTQKTAPAVKVRSFVIIAGVHGSIESAKAEVKTLKIQDVKSKIESKNSKYRVVVGRYTTEKEANKALKKYRKAGHLFLLVEESS
jgi:cell division protein FtsN